MTEFNKFVYLVWEGQYSDAHVVAVFTSRKTARALAKRLDGPTPDLVICGANAYVQPIKLDTYARFDHPQGCFLAAHRDWENHCGGETVQWLPSSGFLSGGTVEMVEGNRYQRAWVRINGYGRTVEHAKRALRDVTRAYKAGAIVADTISGKPLQFPAEET